MGQMNFCHRSKCFEYTSDVKASELIVTLGMVCTSEENLIHMREQGYIRTSPKRTLRCPETKVIRHPEERQDWQYLHMDSGKVLLNFPQIINLCQASILMDGFYSCSGYQ